MVVADSRPALEGREMLRRLLEAGISSTYLDLNALTYIMPEVSKVLGLLPKEVTMCTGRSMCVGACAWGTAWQLKHLQYSCNWKPWTLISTVSH